MSHGEQPPAGHGGHELRDVAFRPIVWGAIGLVLVTVFVFVLSWLVLGGLASREAKLSPPVNPLAARYGRQIPPEPRLQTAPIQDLNQLHAAEDAVLSSYGWADRKSGAVRIPIERAMELLAQRGLPARAAGEVQP